jgi:Flp pilus assembly protein TadB
VRGARITVRCDCGTVAYVAYGERWTCEKCHRRWNTGQIPAEEYWGVMREMRRYRFAAIGMALLFGVTFALLAFLVSQRLLLLLPIVIAGWYLLYMPRWRRRVRQRARNLPSWQLHPE